jgi:CheY-like chemotaxis protein
MSAKVRNEVKSRFPAQHHFEHRNIFTRCCFLKSHGMPTTKKIVAVLSDLMFIVKIQEAAKRAGLQVTFAKTEEEAVEKAQEEPAVIILDLNLNTAEPLALVERLKSDPSTKKVCLLAYVSHVQVELKMAAQQKGCDVVMARSAFSQNLPQILKRYAEPVRTVRADA